jgi:AbrB family looped-hinge helix DNA binding protein
MRVTSKGQVTIPAAIRRHLDLGPGSEVVLEVVGEVVHLRKVSANEARGGRVLARLLAAPYAGPSTDELTALTRRT